MVGVGQLARSVPAVSTGVAVSAAGRVGRGASAGDHWGVLKDDTTPAEALPGRSTASAQYRQVLPTAQRHRLGAGGRRRRGRARQPPGGAGGGAQRRQSTYAATQCSRLRCIERHRGCGGRRLPPGARVERQGGRRVYEPAMGRSSVPMPSALSPGRHAAVYRPRGVSARMARYAQRGRSASAHNAGARYRPGDRPTRCRGGGELVARAPQNPHRLFGAPPAPDPGAAPAALRTDTTVGRPAHPGAARSVAAPTEMPARRGSATPRRTASRCRKTSSRIRASTCWSAAASVPRSASCGAPRPPKSSDTPFRISHGRECPPPVAVAASSIGAA
eukprot:ctg_122.g66